MDEFIKEGDHVVIQKEAFLKIHQLSGNFEVTLGKDKVDLKPLIGKRYWSLFRLVPHFGRVFSLEEATKVQRIQFEGLTQGEDNRALCDDGHSQLLSPSQIHEMRESGMLPAGILSALVQNSTSFQSKTAYSQEKYLKKKEKKYGGYLIVRRPTFRLVAKIFFTRDQVKVLGLREDTLGQILTAANVQPHGNYLLFENGTQALVAAGILTMLDGGRLINLKMGKTGQKQAVDALNMSSSPALLNVSISSLFEEESNMFPEPPVKRPKWADQLEEAKELIKDKVDGLVIASREYPLPLIERLLPFLKPSRKVVVYSFYREPLVQIYLALKKIKKVIGLHLTETWYRQYQVLPDRTHPDVTMSSNGGHILTGTFVD